MTLATAAAAATAKGPRTPKKQTVRMRFIMRMSMSDWMYKSVSVFVCYVTALTRWIRMDLCGSIVREPSSQYEVWALSKSVRCVERARAFWDSICPNAAHSSMKLFVKSAKHNIKDNTTDTEDSPNLSIICTESECSTTRECNHPCHRMLEIDFWIFSLTRTR